MLCPICEIDREAAVVDGRRVQRCKNPKCLGWQKPEPMQEEGEPGENK